MQLSPCGMIWAPDFFSTEDLLKLIQHKQVSKEDEFQILITGGAKNRTITSKITKSESYCTDFRSASLIILDLKLLLL